MSVIPFQHIQAAHCENGVTTSILRHYGIEKMTEPLAFGMGSGLFYFHIPFLTVNKGPAITFRTVPGAIFKRTCQSLGIKVKRKKFKDSQSAKAYLDTKITQNVPVGCQVGVFHLPYFPREYRFHFNAHNLIVFGKDNGKYLVSDPVMEETTSLTAEELDRVRFARGIFAPKGHLYFPEDITSVDDNRFRNAIIKGIQRNYRHMLHAPGPIIGVKGIKFTSRQIRKLRDKMGPKKAGLYLGQIVRMQEEIGTGGGGFRFIYAAFLEQASEYLGDDRLLKFSEAFTQAGDLWRTSAVQMAGIYKGRLTEQKDFEDSADILLDIHEKEKSALKALAKMKWRQ